MWNVGHLDRSYDDSVVQQLHMTSAGYQPSTLAAEAPFYTTRAPSTNGHQNTQAYYPTAVSGGGSTETLAGFQSNPRAFYRANSTQVYSANEYGSTDGNPESSSSASFIASRAGSYDSSFPQAVTPESGMGSHVDTYGYMYSHGQGPAGVVASPPELSPTSGQPHHKKSKTPSRQRKSKHPYPGFPPESLAAGAAGTAAGASASASASAGGASSSSTSNRSKLRSASRTSKNTHHNPPATAEERKSRETHNNVEKQYRNRLNAHFESLLSALPERMQSGDGDDGDDLDAGDRRVSKAEVLEMARRHIKALERECAALEGERDELRDNMERLRWLFGRCEGAAEGSAFLESGAMP
ncbi:putative allergen fus c 3 [Rosellinia necatrix]|uniref:Putative allergen fus c 3 n=1 Tax=Rosellinia necatrix TaxID=77044 RepID=A0A1W2TLW7_ROSNE|nr:putative allergen fus c 3 [Rosellinia necatrix]